MKTYILERVYLETSTPGRLYFDNTSVLTLELPWKDNRRGVSCIPEGSYRVTKEQPIPENDPLGRKARPYVHFRLHDTGSRSGILIHTANYTRRIKGCIIPGLEHLDIDKDGVLDIAKSTPALALLVEKLPDEFTLTIKKK